MSQPSPSHIRATAVCVATLRRLALSVLFTIATTSYQTTCTVSERTFNKRQHANARYSVESPSHLTHYDRFTGQLTNIRHNMDSREQFEMLSTVSNYHPLGFSSTQDPQKIKTPNISFHEHIATPEKQGYIPTSPRNWIMYFIKSGELRHLKNYLKFLQLKDNIPEFQTDEPPHKKQRLTGRARRVDAFRLKQKYLSPELVDMIRQTDIDRSLYTKFKNQLLTSGTIKWRYNQDGRNVCIMNDYSFNGHLMPNSFAHISSEFTDGDTPVIHCSCQIYNFIQNVEIEEGLEIAPETSCMHCRFFQEHLLNAYEVIDQGCTNIARQLEMVRSSNLSMH